MIARGVRARVSYFGSFMTVPVEVRTIPASTPSFEQGPIRPPSEAHSLLVRVIRNCTWNRCTFCPVYKGSGSSLRPLEDVLAKGGSA